MTKKGQTAMEFFLLFSVSMAVLALLFGSIDRKQTAVLENQNHRIAGQIAENVGFQAEMALVQGEGYSRDFHLPKTISATTYNVSIDNRTVYVGWEDSYEVRPTFYAYDPLNLSTNSTDHFRIVHKDAEVSIVER